MTEKDIRILGNAGIRKHKPVGQQTSSWFWAGGMDHYSWQGNPVGSCAASSPPEYTCHLSLHKVRPSCMPLGFGSSQGTRTRRRTAPRPTLSWSGTTEITFNIYYSKINYIQWAVTFRQQYSNTTNEHYNMFKFNIYLLLDQLKINNYKK